METCETRANMAEKRGGAFRGSSQDHHQAVNSGNECRRTIEAQPEKNGKS